MTKHLTAKDAEHIDTGRLFPPVPDESRLMVSCPADHFSASRLARAVEDCDAHVLNLNVTDMPADGGRMTVELRVSVRNAEAIVRSVERYGYDVVDVLSDAFGPSPELSSTARDRVNELLHILDI